MTIITYYTYICWTSRQKPVRHRSYSLNSCPIGYVRVGKAEERCGSPWVPGLLLRQGLVVHKYVHSIPISFSPHIRSTCQIESIRLASAPHYLILFFFLLTLCPITDLLVGSSPNFPPPTSTSPLLLLFLIQNNNNTHHHHNSHTHFSITQTKMPRQRSMGGGRSAPSRPTVPARAPTNPQGQQQTRPAATHAAPPAAAAPQAAPQAASGGSGLFGQMASTAAYVPVPMAHCLNLSLSP